MELSEDLPLCTPAVLNSVPVPSLCNFQLVGMYRFYVADQLSNLTLHIFATECNLFSLLSKRASEEKYMVRKNAVHALEQAICRGYIPATKEALSLLDQRSRDPLLSIRKSAIQSLTNVLTVSS